jgi:hypothetical protein
MTGTGSFTQQVENTGALPTVANAGQELEMSLEFPGRSEDMLSLSQRLTRVYRFPAFDGHLDFSGTSGTTHVFPVRLSGEITFTSREDLARFTTNPFVDLYLSVEGETEGFIRRGRGIIDGFVTAGADITMFYGYLPIPEPSTLVAVCFSLLCAVFALNPDHFKRRLYS